MATTAVPGKPLGVSSTTETPGEVRAVGQRTMICEGCLQIRPWNPWLRCSRRCYERPRATPQQQAAAAKAAPEAFAYFDGPVPGRLG
jgi:hypothetical protein